MAFCTAVAGQVRPVVLVVVPGAFVGVGTVDDTVGLDALLGAGQVDRLVVDAHLVEEWGSGDRSVDALASSDRGIRLAGSKFMQPGRSKTRSSTRRFISPRLVS